MATVSEVITDRLAAYSIELTPVRLESALVDIDLNGSVPYDASQVKPVKQVIVSVMSDLLAMPDVSEGGFSVKWDRKAVESYCNLLRTELTPPVVAAVPTVSDRSYFW